MKVHGMWVDTKCVGRYEGMWVHGYEGTCVDCWICESNVGEYIQ